MHLYAHHIPMKSINLNGSMSIWVCLKIVYPIVPNGFADPYPVFKWLAIIGNIANIFRQTHFIPYGLLIAHHHLMINGFIY